MAKRQISTRPVRPSGPSDPDDVFLENTLALSTWAQRHRQYLVLVALAVVVVVVGGIVPNCEVPTLTDAGVGAVFHPGSSRVDIVATISNLILEHRGI